MIHTGGNFWPSSSFHGGMSFYFILRILFVFTRWDRHLCWMLKCVFLFCFYLQADSLEDAISIINKNKYLSNTRLLSSPYIKQLYNYFLLYHFQQVWKRRFYIYYFWCCCQEISDWDWGWAGKYLLLLGRTLMNDNADKFQLVYALGLDSLYHKYNNVL